MTFYKDNVIEERELTGIKVLSDTGYVNVNSIVKKGPFQVWEVRTKFDRILAADKHILFKKDFKEVFVKDLKEGDKIITKNGLEPVLFVKPTNQIEYMYDLVLGEDSNQRYYVGDDQSILSHNSTIFTVFALYYCLFNSDKTILLCANKEKTVKEILSRIKLAYMKLPAFLKIGITNWSSKEIEFENGSRIQITATSSDGARGASCDVCVSSDSWMITLLQGQLTMRPIIEIGCIKNKKIITKKDGISFKKLLEDNINNNIDPLLFELFKKPYGFKQVAYHIETANTTIPKCPICGKPLINRYSAKNKCYQITCSMKCQREFNRRFGTDFEISNNIKILTPFGFKSFEAISINWTDSLITINNDITCTETHKFETYNGLKWANELEEKDCIKTILNVYKPIESLKKENKSAIVFDIVNIDNPSHLFYCNDLVNHNCILDEAAFIPENIMADFTQSVFPTIASRPDGKIICVSTPMGNTNWFARTFHRALYQQQTTSGDLKDNSDDPFRWNAITFPWYEHPDRDENWKKKQLSMFNGDERRFDVEFNCQFLGSTATLFEPKVLEELKKFVINTNNTKCLREEIINERNIKIFKEPIKDHVYVMGADIGDGSGEDYSCIQIWDITNIRNLELCLSFGSNTIPISEFAFLSAKLGARYNYALISGERNGVGTSYFDTLWNVFEYENIVCYVNDETPPDKPGIYSTNKTKLKACLWARDFVNMCIGEYKLFNLIIHDSRIVYEMESFERKNKTGTITYAASKNMHDDFIMCFIWSLFPLINNIADLFLDIKDTIKTAIGLEIPVTFRNNNDLLYTEELIDSKFVNNNSINDIKASETDVKSREMISDAIYSAVMNPYDLEENW